jgi:hypothetical protein
LIEQGYKSIQFEPRGKSLPPDFSIEGNIGIEVRRMNQHININYIEEPIEKFDYKFLPKFRKMLRNITLPDLPFSISITLRYERPVKVNNLLYKKLKSAIINNTLRINFEKEIKFNDQISFLLYKKELQNPQFYVSTWTDRDSTINVQKERYKSFKICVEDKNDKLEEIKNEFSELWLILIDTIFNRVDEGVQHDFKRFPKVNSIFDRYILISKLTKNWIDIYKYDK